MHEDNFYTSYELVLSFLQQKTRVVGTLRSSKKNELKAVMASELKRGEMVSRKDKNFVVVLKRKDAKDVRMLFTKHKPEFVEVRRRSRKQSSKSKEDTGVDVVVSGQLNAPVTESKTRGCDSTATRRKNKGKSANDLSDQNASYATTLRKGKKWYRKLGIELLFGLIVSMRV